MDTRLDQPDSVTTFDARGQDQIRLPPRRPSLEQVEVLLLELFHLEVEFVETAKGEENVTNILKGF